MAKTPTVKEMQAALASRQYKDAPTGRLEDWKWNPLAEVQKKLAMEREIPDYIQKGYGGFMNEQLAKAKAGQLSPRDLIKAYAITQSSIGRGGLSHGTATKAGMKLPNTGGEVRPEGAFAEWLGSPMGQRYMDAAERGELHQPALEDLRAKFAPFGKQNEQVNAMIYAAQTLPGKAAGINQAISGPTNEFRDYAEGLKGIAGAKSGFIGSLLGRGDLPTLDARQLNLHAGKAPVGIGAIMKRGKGQGAREAVDRLAARQRAMGFAVDPSMEPHYQHLAHHAVWDKAADTQTTHEDLVKALRGYADGGDVEAMKREMEVKRFAKGGEQTWPANLPPAPVPSNQEMTAIVDRIARQQLGEHVTKPGETTNLAGRSIKEAKRIKQTQYELKPTREVRPTPVYAAKTGDVNVVLPGDQTISDQQLVSLNDKPIGSDQEGGSRYGEGKLHLPKAKRPFWASGPGPAQGFQNRVTELAQITGQEPSVIAHHLAMGRAGNNFALHFADANLKAIGNSEIKPEHKETFNTVMQQGFADRDKRGNPIQVTFPHWPGVENPTLAYKAMQADPEMRKWFNDRMKTSNLTKALGFPNGLDVEYAISEPELRNMEINMTGHAVGKMVPGAKLIPGADHNTYSHKILGTSLGRAPELAPMELSFLDATHYIKPKLSSPGAYTRTMSLSAPHQVVDDRYLNMMNDYYTKLRAVRGYAEGGKAEPDLDEMRLANTLRKPKKKALDIRSVGVDEAPDMAVKTYVSPGLGKATTLPIGGVDFAPMMPGQQLAPGAGTPGQPQPPQQPQGGPGGPGEAPPAGPPGSPPIVPMGGPAPGEAPVGQSAQTPQSNILAMTRQGQALRALSPVLPPPKKKAAGGVVGSRNFQEVEAPEKTTKAYKLFRTHPKHPGKLFPLFVDADTPIDTGKWYAAQAGEMKGEKVKSKIGPLAYRPGWHAGDLPVATHIGEKSDPAMTKPDTRPANHVWAEVEMPNDVDWQSEATRRGTNAKGKVIPVKSHITDQIPHGGHYRYKTNSNMTGNWLIGGAMKVNRVLPDEEVAAINKAAGTADLPRRVLKKATGGIVHMAGGSQEANLRAMREEILQKMGQYGARRLDRAADEIPNLSKLYTPQALREAFTGDNAQAIMSMNPAHFERYAKPLPERTLKLDPETIAARRAYDAREGTHQLKLAMPTSDYIHHLAEVAHYGGFDDVPYLKIDKEEAGLPITPHLVGHEGRHRNRALAAMGQKKGLVRLFPRAELREPLPRRSQEEYIEALRKEVPGNMVTPEPLGEHRDEYIRRGAIALPDFYNKGGSVEQMSAELREKGRQKFLAPSAVKQVMYHGTAQDIKEFRPKQVNATFLSPDPKFAHGFAQMSEEWMKLHPREVFSEKEYQDLKDAATRAAGNTPFFPAALDREVHRHMPSAQNTMPVHVQAKNPFDYENPRHMQALRNYLPKRQQYLLDEGGATPVAGNNWRFMESEPIQNAIMDMGHDSFWSVEHGAKNLGVYNPKAIKSAIGNRGTYDTSHADLTKKSGGKVTLPASKEQMERELKRASHFKQKV